MMKHGPELFYTAIIIIVSAAILSLFEKMTDSLRLLLFKI